MSAMFTARPARPRWHVPAAIGFVLATMVGGLVDVLVPAQATSAGTIQGVVFDDADRDGVLSPDETPFPGIYVRLYDADRTVLISGTQTTADGSFSLPTDGRSSYLVEIGVASWRELRHDWTPSALPGVSPSWPVAMDGTSTFVPMGLRLVVRSTDTPFTTFVGPSGVSIESYNDKVTAEQIHDALMQGTLIGPEAEVTTITHDRGGATACTTGASRTDGEWTRFSANCHMSWLSWMSSGDVYLFHEYGHAWSLYHAYLTQQDPELTAYLAVRGLTDDPRLETSHGWSRRELIAEDYRQLFGSVQARAAAQENRDLPPADDVPGLRDYLASTFITPVDTADPEPDPVFEPSPDPEPEPDPRLEPDPDPSPEPDDEATEDPTTKPKRGNNGGGGGPKAPDTCRGKNC